LFLNSRDTQIGRGETIADSARMMSRYLNGIMIRTYTQESVEELARYASISVINGLTDLFHPCQILSDLFTIIEKKGSYEKIKVAYIGDGNNIANSWIEAAARLPIQLALACPKGYEPDKEIMAKCSKEASEGITLYNDPMKAATNADVLYTDVWTSMGQEAEDKKRKKIFKNYQINKKLLEEAKKDAIVMHCLPAHRGEEITAEVIDGPHSVVIDEAENRLHVQKAILEILL
jgi:ornithine carbamoyltransferase